jgi:hypothetical protein
MGSKWSGKRWVVAVIKKMWDISWDLWEHKNHVLHKQDYIVRDQSIRMIKYHITTLFMRLHQGNLLDNVRHLIHLPLSDLLSNRLDYKIGWLKVAEPALAREKAMSWRHADDGDKEKKHEKLVGRKWITLMKVGAF